MTTNPHITRFRRRVPPPDSPQVSLPLRSQADRTRISSEGATIRNLRVAFEETPIKLRELEDGWRERRRVGLKELGVNGIKGDRAAVDRRQEAVTADGAGRLPRTRPPKESKRDSEVTVRGETARPRPPEVPPHALPLPPPPPPPTSAPMRPPRPIPTVASGLQAPPALLLSSPLPPTARPVRLTSRSIDTVHIHPPASPIGITLSLRKDTQLVRVSQDGRNITFASPTQPGSASKRQQSRLLDLGRWGKWSEGDKRDWELVRRLVEGYKKQTPKVRLYLPLGHLTITCSSPPDVVLDFAHTTTTPNGDSRKSSSSSTITKVRVRLSRLANEITVDTASADTSKGERLRSKRSVKFPSPSCDYRNPPDKPGGDTLGLKAVVRRAEAWSDAEREGVRRLWELREEWGRYG